MPGNSAGRVILAHQFTHKEQLRFAALSGDANPLHIDPLEARRTLMGAPVVHGMRLAFLALQALSQAICRSVAIASIRCRFPSPVLVGDKFELRLEHLDERGSQLEGYVETDLAFELSIEFAKPTSDDEPLPSLQPVPLQDLSFDELTGTAGSLPVGIDAELARSLFPSLIVGLGLPLIAELLALTRLVGMRCPGRNSLFSQLDVNIRKVYGVGELQFRVTAVDERFKRINIQVDGARLTGKLIVFFRPPPQPQPTMAELAKRLRCNEFSNGVALVVGGSRGLGEITAKLLAAGSARVILSYHRGEQDAMRVAAEINGFGGHCEYVGLDISDSESVVRKIFASAAAPRTIYYFATPHIFARRRSFFSSSLLQKFVDFYVIGFSRLIEAASSESKPKLRVFCPSTVAIDENLRELAEYSIAKQMAEELCAFYNRFSTNVHCVVERLPRLNTDQTATLVELPHEDSVRVMLSIVRRVEHWGD
jgi:acyl dehydratase